MKKQQLFIFRVSKGNPHGNPRGSCSLDYSNTYKERDTITEFQNINYDSNGHLDFLHEELWENHIIRQGWGIKNLDLNKESWIKRYILSSKKFWGIDIDCHQAKGRWNILNRMTMMNLDDLIIIPKTSRAHKQNDYSKFSICQVKETYYFDYLTDYKDFGHCLKIKNIREYPYSSSTLLASHFSAPYLYAVSQVKNHHSRFHRFEDFVKRTYNIQI